MLPVLAWPVTGGAVGLPDTCGGLPDAARELATGALFAVLLPVVDVWDFTALV